MYKKLMILGLLLVPWWLATYDDQIIPYEKFIATEYNRIRGGADRYVSYNSIMNQNLRGKSMEKKYKILANLRGLKLAVHKAYLQAEEDGKNLWYYFYMLKDNNHTIQSLIEYEADVTNKIRQIEAEMESDIAQLFRYLSPYFTGAIIGITLLWLTQKNLSYSYYVEHKKHGLVEMFTAPVQAVIQEPLKKIIQNMDLFLKAAPKVDIPQA